MYFHKYIILCFIVLLISCQKSTISTEQYYRHIYLNHKYQFDGKYPITQKDSKTINCYKFVYNPNGLPLSIEYLKGGLLSDDDEPNYENVNKTTDYDFAKINFNYNEGEETRKFYNDNLILLNSEKLLLNQNGLYKSLHRFDKYGNKLINRNHDFVEPSKSIFHYDENNRIIKVVHYNHSGGKYSIGYIIPEIPEIQFKYDDLDNLIQEEYYGLTGFLKANLYTKSYCAIKKLEYDKDKNIVKESYFDISGNPVNNKIAYSINEYNEFGYITKQTDFDALGNIMSNDDYSSVEIKYDKNGNIVSVETLDEFDNLKNDRDGTAITKIEYDSFGNMIKEGFYGTDNKLVKETSCSTAVREYYYDDFRNLIELRTYDELGQLTPNNCENDCAISKYKYDSNGFYIEESYFDVNGNPSPIYSWYERIDDYSVTHIWSEITTRKLKRDSLGRTIETAYYDKNGRLTLYRNGSGKFRFAIRRNKYDLNGNLIEESYYGLNGELVQYPPVSPTYPVLWSDLNYSIVQYEYDELGNKIQKTFFNEKLNLLEYRTYQYNDIKEIRTTHFDKFNVVTYDYEFKY